MGKGEKRKGVGESSEAVNETYKNSVSNWTVLRYVTNGMVGQSPLKMGPD